MKGIIMKKILLSLMLAASLLLSTMLVACDGGDDYENGESRLPVETHGDETDPTEGTSENDGENNSALGVGEDTEDGWSEVHQ